MDIDELRQWLRLIRLQSGAATAITPVFGALVVMSSNGFDIVHLIILFIMGLLLHIYGFVLNEYCDLEVDRFSEHLLEKPLIKGTIEREQALYFSITVMIVLIAMGIIFFFDTIALLTLIIAITLGGIYDIFGKKFFGADFVLGGCIFFFTIYGALTVSLRFDPLVILVAFLFFLQLSFQTGVTGGMKDIPHDYAANVKTSPVYLGCRVESGKLIITEKFKAYVLSMKLLHIAVIFAAILFGLVPIPSETGMAIFQMLLLLFLLGVMLLAAEKAVSMRRFHRAELMKTLGTIEIATYPTTPLLLLGVLGIYTVLFLMFFPIVWLVLFVFIIYGKPMPEV